jgi:ethanolamine-phosphate cytidylyltransferase
MVRAIKWVDEVVEGSTYWPNADTMKQYNCDFAAHGDDISVATDGRDPYAALKDAGLLRIYRRTEGVSTTDIVGRMLLMTKDHHFRHDDGAPADALVYSNDSSGHSPWTRVSQFLQTSNKIVQFSEGREAKPGDRIVYACGDWDLLHPGHVDFLEAARKEGDYLIVGIHSDHRPQASVPTNQKGSSVPQSSYTADPIYRNVVEKVVNRHKGGNYPIMNLHERTLSVLACRYVSEVVIGAPYQVTPDLIKQFNISLVVHGWTKSTYDQYDCYAVPKQLGIFKTIDTGNRLTTNEIVQRIIEHRLEFELRNKKKEDREVSHVIKSSMVMG